MQFNLSQAIQLVQFFGGHDADVTVEEGDGHSGHGLYASCTDYPEEGSVLLDPKDEVVHGTADSGRRKATVASKLNSK